MKASFAQEVRTVQRCYPQIYLACHKTHIRAASTPYQLSSQDSSILVHLDLPKQTTPRQLARHLGVKPSTLSASIKRLRNLGYLEKISNARDRRSFSLKLTPKGAEATSATSVLDPERVEKLLKLLDPKLRAKALHGLQILANASLRLSSDTKKGGNR